MAIYPNLLFNSLSQLLRERRSRRQCGCARAPADLEAVRRHRRRCLRVHDGSTAVVGEPPQQSPPPNTPTRRFLGPQVPGGSVAVRDHATE